MAKVAAQKPPGALGQVGMSLWDDITQAYTFEDRASLETLYQACCAAERAASLRARIDRDGEVVQTRGQLRVHPALKAELDCRNFVVRALAKLGLDLEPVRAGPGRPPTYA